MPELTVERIERLTRGDLADLCDATVAAIGAGIGFGWVRTPSRQRLEAYWKGVLVVPERVLYLGRLDGTVAAAAQLVKPAPNFEVGVFSASLETHFVAPWARGHGLAKMLLEAVEASARDEGCTVMRLDVRATQARAIALYEASGYRRWGTLDSYHLVHGQMIPGYFYVKNLAAPRPKS